MIIDAFSFLGIGIRCKQSYGLGSNLFSVWTYKVSAIVTQRNSTKALHRIM